jgi:hypothetical protein
MSEGSLAAGALSLGSSAAFGYLARAQHKEVAKRASKKQEEIEKSEKIEEESKGLDVKRPIRKPILKVEKRKGEASFEDKMIYLPESEKKKKEEFYIIEYSKKTI